MINNEEFVRPTVVEVNIKAIKQNYFEIKKAYPDKKIMCIIKANAYGHGLVEMAQVYEKIGADYLGVAVVEEGIILRKAGITIPILVLGGIWGNQIPLFIKYNLMITASSIDKLAQIDQISKEFNTKTKVHLKIDTGLERIGVHYYNAHKFILEAHQFDNIIIDGVYSHFASSDSNDLSYSRLQIERFEEAISIFEKNSLPFPLRHFANSGAVLQIPEAAYDMIRPGIMLYGVYPSENVKKSIELIPALTWKSRVVYFKVIKPDHPVGYGSTWQSDHMTRAVTVPVGYGDGYFRKLSNRAQVIINNNKYPVVGVISMDQMVVNIEKDSAYNGDEVILLGKSQDCLIDCADLAGWAETIPYEILTNINNRVPRKYTDD